LSTKIAKNSESKDEQKYNIFVEYLKR